MKKKRTGEKEKSREREGEEETHELTLGRRRMKRVRLKEGIRKGDDR